jgi:hypothetical protein
MSTTVRELKLLPEFAHLYPGLTANVWIRGAVLAQWLSARPPAQEVVSDRHFVFRQGVVPEFAA